MARAKADALAGAAGSSVTGVVQIREPARPGSLAPTSPTHGRCLRPSSRVLRRAAPRHRNEGDHPGHLERQLNSRRSR